MYKSLRFTTLHLLISDFIKCYREYHHEVLVVSIGLPFSHDDCSEIPIQWKVWSINMVEVASYNQLANALDRYTRDCLFIFDFYSRTGRLPEFCTREYLSGKYKG